jgi:hypothetical protein
MRCADRVRRSGYVTLFLLRLLSMPYLLRVQVAVMSQA